MSDNITNPLNPAYYPPEGTPVATAITPGGTFGAETNAITHYAKLGQGGYRSVNTYEDLTTIPEKRLELGMMVNVIADSNVNNNGLWILDSIDANNTRNWKKSDINSDELTIGTITKYTTTDTGVSTVELGQSIINGGFDYSTSTPAGNMIGTKGWYVDAAWIEKETTDMYTPVRYMNDKLSPNRLQIELLPYSITTDVIKYRFPKTYTNSTGTYNFIPFASSNKWRVTYENGTQQPTIKELGNISTNNWSGSTEGDYYILEIPLYDTNSPLVKIEYYLNSEWQDLNYGTYTWYAYLHCANSYPKIFLPGVNDVDYPPESTRVIQYGSREDFFNEIAKLKETDHINMYDGANKPGLIDSLVGKAISYFPRFGSTDAVAEWVEDETNKCIKWTSGVSIVTDSQGNELLKANDVLKAQTQIALKLESFKGKNGAYGSYTDSNVSKLNILRVSSLANTSYTWNDIPPSQYEVYQYFFSYIKGLYFDETTGETKSYNGIANDTKNMPIVPQYFGEVDRGSPNGNCINIIDEPLVGGMDIYTDVYVFGLDANKTAGNSNMTVGKENQTYQSFGLAVGRKNYTIGYANFAAGKENKVGGEYSAAIGNKNTTLSSGSYAIGTGNKVGNTKSNKYSSLDIAIGKGLDLTNNDNASSDGGRVAVGRYNKNEPDSIFVVGNGTDTKNRSTAFEVTTSGLTKANGGLIVSDGTLKISKGYLNLVVYTEKSDGTGWEIPDDPQYGEVKLVEIGGELALYITDTGKIASLPSNATVNDSIEMQIYDFNDPDKATGNTALLQCVQLGDDSNPQYSLRIFR